MKQTPKKAKEKFVIFPIIFEIWKSSKLQLVHVNGCGGGIVVGLDLNPALTQDT